MNFKVNQNANISGTSLLVEVKTTTTKLEALFPEVLKLEDWPSISNQMKNIAYKYSDAIIVTYGDTNEIYTIYTLYGKFRIGGSEEDKNLNELIQLLTE